MEETISTIKKLDMKKEDIHSIIMLDRTATNDLKFLEDEFDFFKEDISKFLASYKNVGVVFKLKPIHDNMLVDWKIFLKKTIKPSFEFSKFNNLFISNKYNKLLLITNKRLSKIDMKKLNEKIEEINYRIESYNDKINDELKDLAEATKDDRGFFAKIMSSMKK